MLHLSPHDRSFRQFRKKWTTCFDYLRFSLGIELRLVTAVADSILRLTGAPTAGYELRLSRVRAAGYKLRLILSWGWLKFKWLATSCSRFYVAADSSSAGWTRHAAQLYFNISSKFKDLFCKIHHFDDLFSTACFQLLLIQALVAPSRTLLEEASRL